MKFDAVLGIDVGWSEGKATTGLCTIGWNDNGILVQNRRARANRVDRLKAIDELVEGKRLLAVGIDGPLVPNLEIRAEYRAAESLLSRGKFQRRGKPGPTNGGSGPRLHKEATKLAKLVVENQDVAPANYLCKIHEKAVIEAFPNAFLAVLHPDVGFPGRPIKKRKWTDTLFPLVKPTVRLLLDNLLQDKRKSDLDDILDDITEHEDIASFVCALTALCVVQGRCVSVGSRTQGWIALPPIEFWGDSADGTDKWAMITLRGNLDGVRKRFSDVEIYNN